jgi:hypothetical protein
MIDEHFEAEHGGQDRHNHSVTGELICHLPYAIFSVAFGLIVASFLTYMSEIIEVDTNKLQCCNDVLFHSFHFMHIVFAATGTLITFLRFSHRYILGTIVAIGSTFFFCTLSDVVLPYFIGTALGIPMHFHVCMVSELRNVLPFLLVGLLNGHIMSLHHSSRQGVFSIFSHFIHILISSFASLFYLMAEGFTQWYEHMGPIFLFLVVAVVVPCTLSDLVVPMAFARAGKNHEKH